MAMGDAGARLAAPHRMSPHRMSPHRMSLQRVAISLSDPHRQCIREEARQAFLCGG